MLANEDGELLIMGGYAEVAGITRSHDEIYRYEETGELTQAGTLQTPRGQGMVFSRDGDTYILYGRSNDDRLNLLVLKNLEKLVRNQDGTFGSVTVAENAMPPEADTGESDFAILAAVAAYDDGIILTGPVKRNAFGGILTDTWLMEITENGVTFTEADKLFSATKCSNAIGTICDGRYYVLANTSQGDNFLRFGYLSGYESTEYTTVKAGDYVVRYVSRIPYNGSAIKTDDLKLTVRNSAGDRMYLPGSVSYKTNKNAGSGRFVIKTITWEAVRDPFTVSKAAKDVKKALAKEAFSFRISKRTLNENNTKVTRNKKGKVTSVKFILSTDANGKQKTLTVPGKDYEERDGIIYIKATSANYQGKIDTRG